MTDSPIRMPNFFIIGAPKCGTTAIVEYLRTHPDVYFPEIKEPFYWCDDLPGVRSLSGIDTFEKYSALYKRAKISHKAVGEASTLYLYSKKAIRHILDFDPDAKIICMVRNPIDFIRSYHLQLLKTMQEDESDLVKAWSFQDKRLAGQSIPKHNCAPELLQYRDIARLGTQLERVCEQVPQGNLLVLQFKNFVDSPKTTYETILNFLGLPNDCKKEFQKVNEAALPIWKPLTLLLRSKPIFNLSQMAKRCLPDSISANLKRVKHGLMYKKIDYKNGASINPGMESIVESLKPECIHLDYVCSRISRKIEAKKTELPN